MGLSKGWKSLKVRYMEPLLPFCRGLVVVLRRGCKGFGELIIFYLKIKRPWYLMKGDKSQIFDRDNI